MAPANPRNSQSNQPKIVRKPPPAKKTNTPTLTLPATTPAITLSTPTPTPKITLSTSTPKITLSTASEPKLTLPSYSGGFSSYPQ